MKALSIRQPWAWLIVYCGKDIENRTWRTNVRGTILVHASKGMTRREYDEVRLYSFMPQLPPFEALQRGGIIGTVDIVDCVTDHDSPWFFGPVGFVLRNPRALDFRPCVGQLGFFEVSGENP